jgi:uncharacterized repeat protein (TIGR01451 family)
MDVNTKILKACCPIVSNGCQGNYFLLYEWNYSSDYYFLVYTNDPVNCGTFSLRVEPGIEGCIDPNASNYSSCANIPDDSCIFENPPANDVCIGAIPMTCASSVIGSTSNSSNTDSPILCSDDQATGVWYTCQGDGSVYTFTACSEWINTRIQVYSGTCGDLICVGQAFTNYDNCGDNEDASISFLSEEGLTYYILVSGEDLEGVFTISFDCEEELWGCTDVNACNFLPEANLNDGTCEYSLLHGYLFYDTNSNGVLDDEFYDESFLQNISVVLQPVGISAFTDENGYFEFPEVEPGEYFLEVDMYNESWYISTLNPLFSLPGCEDHAIGVSSADYIGFMVSEGTVFTNILHCDDGVDAGKMIYNLGNLPFDGQLTMTFSPVLELENDLYDWTQSPDIVNSGEAIWYIDNQAVFSSIMCGVHILGPGSDYVGETFNFSFHLQLYDSEGNTFYNETSETELEVSCSYDPNDKTTAFSGYTEEHHFILAEDEIEYKIRFQNTGNFPAQDVNILDSLDLEYLDISSFQPLYGTHNFMTTLQPNGLVTFHFENIQLPDSTSQPEESQGYVVYKIRPRSDVEHLDVIHNQAYIYFDQNPPIITNETWHTIMDCDSLGNIEGPESCCVGTTCEFNGPSEFIESYSWSIDGEEFSTQSLSDYTFTESGLNYLVLNLVNPICNVNEFANVFVNPFPSIEITNTDSQLIAADGISWQWYHDGEILADETEQHLVPGDLGFTEGYFSVFVTNEFGCSVWSEEIFFTTTSDLQNESLLVYPNPTKGDFTILLPKNLSGETISFFDVSGKLIYSTKTTTHYVTISYGTLAPGAYTVNVGDAKNFVVSIVVE